MLTWDRSHDYVLHRFWNDLTRVTIRFRGAPPSVREWLALRRCLPQFRDVATATLRSQIGDSRQLALGEMPTPEARSVIEAVQAQGLEPVSELGPSGLRQQRDRDGPRLRVDLGVPHPVRDQELSANGRIGHGGSGLPWALSYRKPARIAGATLVKNDPGDLNHDGFNESEGCYVLQGPGPLQFTNKRGQAAGFAPAFKVLGWPGKAPKTVIVDGMAVPVASAVVEGKLLFQLLGRMERDKVSMEVMEAAP